MALIKKLTALADAVREKTGGDQLLTLDEMAEQIHSLAKDPEKPYIDSTTLALSYFCCDGQNLDVLFHPNFDISAVEDVNHLFFHTYMLDLPKGHLAFPSVKNATQMFAALKARGILEYGADLSQLEVSLPSAETAYGMFEGTYMGKMPVTHLGATCLTFERMFYDCCYLTEVDLRDAIGVTNFKNMFTYCYALESVALDMRAATSYKGMFSGCGSLSYLSIGSLKIVDNEFRLDGSPYLSEDSLLGILNAIQSNAGEATTYTVFLGDENLVKLTDEQKQIAIDKNLTLA